MKKVFSIFMFALSFVMLFSACSKEPNNPIDRDFNNTGFKQIDAGDVNRLTVTRGSSFSIHANGEERDINDLVIRNSGDTLSIRFSRYKVNRKIVRFTITMPSCEGMILSGQAQAIIGGFTETNPVRLTVSGQAASWINMSAPKFFAEASGQSKIEFQGGNSTGFEANASGQSDILAYGLAPVVSAIATASGQSTIKVKVSNNLRASASGQSRIYYQGSPLIANISETGQAKVIQQ